MVHFDRPETARSHAEAALLRLDELGLAPYPDSFKLWFTYYTGRDPELTRALDTALAGKHKLDDGRCLRIYERFFGTRERDDVLFSTGSNIETAVDSIIKHIDQLNTSARRYGQTLEGYAERVDAAESRDNIRKIVGEIVTKTSRMVHRNRELERRLDNSSKEIRNLRTNLAKVRTESLTDELTGIVNRRGFEHALREQAIVAVDEGEPLAMLLLDIDHFKGFNDTYGHPMGDEMLKLVARSLTRSIKGRDTACRYGGEEFAIILPRTPLEAACIVAEQIREHIGEKNVVKKTTGEVLGRITVSIGAALFRPGEPLTELTRRADKALYAAKNGGRNRVVGETASPADDGG